MPIGAEINERLPTSMLAAEFPPPQHGEPDLVLLGCGKTKVATETAVPAADLYTGPLFKARRKFAAEDSRPWMILSAAHGVVEPGKLLEPYDTTISDLKPAEKQAWEKEVRAKVLEYFDGRNGTIGKSIELHAGSDYVKALNKALTGLGIDVVPAFQNKGIGVQLSIYSNGYRRPLTEGGIASGVRAQRLAGPDAADLKEIRAAAAPAEKPPAVAAPTEFGKIGKADKAETPTADDLENLSMAELDALIAEHDQPREFFTDAPKVADFENLPRKNPEDIMPAPAKKVRAELTAGPHIPQEQATARIGEWKAEAQRIGREEDHSQEVILSLFDHSGVWSKPWEEAGYRVIRYDIKDGSDLVAFMPMEDIIGIREAGFKIKGVLAAPPCTSFAVSGARWWKTQHDLKSSEMVEKKYGLWATEYFETPLEYAETMVHVTEAIIEFSNPDFHVMENPIGRIKTVASLPDPLMVFDPHHYGDPYTKRTQLWGDFNTNLPSANVEPALGSLMHKLRGDVEADKAARSQTPEGFAYSFFMANHGGGGRRVEGPQPATPAGELLAGDVKTPEQLASERAAEEARLLDMQQKQDVRVGAAAPLRATEDTRPAADMFEPETQSDIFDQPPRKETTLEKLERQRAEDEYRAEMEADLADLHAGSIELLAAIERLGGMPSANSKVGKEWQGELATIREMSKGGAGAKGIFGGKLFRTDALHPDALVSNLRDLGFDFETFSDLLTALDMRFRDGKPIFPIERSVSDQYALEGFGPGAASAKEPLPKYQARKFATRLQADEALVQELKDAAGNRFYEPISNRVTADQGQALIEERGIAQSINLIQDAGNGIKFRTRVAVGEIIIKRLNEAVESLQGAGRQQEAALLSNKAADLAEWAVEYGTELGEGVQAFAMWNRLTPAGKLLQVQRMVKKTRDKFVQEHGPDITDVVEGAQDVAGEAKGEPRKRGNRKLTQEEKVNEAKVDELVKREQDKIARQLSDTPTWQQVAKKKQNEILALIRAHLKERQKDFLEKMAGFEVDGKLSESIDLIAAENRRRIESIRVTKKLAARAAQFDRAADNIAQQLSDTPTFRAKGQIDPARELIRLHLKNSQPNFVARLVEYGSSKTTAEMIDRLSIENRERILKVDRARRAEELRSSFGRKNPVARKLRKPDWQKIVELADHGLLSERTFMDAAGQKLGLPQLTAEAQAEILKMARAIERAPEGDPRNKATLELNKYIAAMKGFDAKDVPIGIYYGNMLSGYNTQAVNALDTFFNVGSEINGLALVNPRAAMKIYSNLARGLKEGTLDALLAITEGRMITDGKWLEIPKLMEIAKFGEKGGVPIRVTGKGSAAVKALLETKPAYILRGWKYVGRLMAASDAIMFRGAKEARMALLADRVARGEGLRGRALTNRVHELLGLDEPQQDSFAQQAADEGYTGIKATMRERELRDLARPKEASADATDFAGESTYNHQPHGLLGRMAASVEDFGRDQPLMKAVVVPFTRIVANVTNRGINYTPWGFKRAFYGYSKEAAPVGDVRNAMLARAAMGTIGLTLLTVLHESEVIDINGAGPSDPERRRQLLNAGWKPYSVKLGDEYVSYAYTPLGLGLSVLGNVFDAIRYRELQQQDALTRGGYALSRVGSTVFSQSFLSGASGFFRALSGAPGTAVAATKQILSSTVGTFTTPSIVRDMQRLFDPKVYKADDIKGDLLRNTPFAASVNRPALNAFGEPVVHSLNRFHSSASKDPAWQFVVSHELRVPVPDKYTQLSDGRGGKKRITPEQYYSYLQESGRQVKRLILDKRGDWGKLERDEMQDELSKESAKIRKKVKKSLEPR